MDGNMDDASVKRQRVGTSSGHQPGVAQNTTTRPQPQIPLNQYQNRRSQNRQGGNGGGASQHAIIVSKRQEGNPVLQHIRNVRWQYGDIVPDYLLGKETCALFLSLRYHLLHPDYIFHRIQQIKYSFRLRLLVCHVDIEDVVKPLEEVTKCAILNDCTMICAWSPKECARYLETFKSYESKPAHIIQEKVDNDYVSRLTAAMTTIRGVNKTDSVTLGSKFNSLANVMTAPKEDLSACPGIGPTKLERLHEAFHQPFRMVPSSAKNPIKKDSLNVSEKPQTASEIDPIDPTNKINKIIEKKMDTEGPSVQEKKETREGLDDGIDDNEIDQINLCGSDEKGAQKINEDDNDNNGSNVYEALGLEVEEI